MNVRPARVHGPRRGARIDFRVTRPNGAVTTHSTTTSSRSAYQIKIPMSTADTGTPRIEAFYDGAGKYGAKHIECTVEVF
jgi:hypothetical protein